MVQIDGQGNLLRAAYSRLPGEIQTVPRAELFALIILLQQVLPGSDVKYVTDHKNIFLNYPKGIEYNRNSLNFDVYPKVYELVDF